jgi:hypothetical protein
MNTMAKVGFPFLSTQPSLKPSLQFKLDDVVDEINEHHVGGWTEMITTSNPPVPKTPLSASAYMDNKSLSRHVVAFNNTKLKNVVGYNLKKPKFDHEAIKEMVDKWKAEGSWPNLP